MQNNSNKNYSKNTAGISTNKKSAKSRFDKQNDTADNKRNSRTASAQQPKKSASKKSKSSKELDPQMFVQRAQVDAKIDLVTIDTRFDQMDIHPNILANLEKMSFIHPTEIQLRTYDQLVKRKNLIGIANTGTGKTGAFLLPLLQRLLTNPSHRFQSLIVVPTRELALQVFEEFNKLTEGLKFNAGCFIGGTNINKDLVSLKKQLDITIATPGRLIDLSNRGDIKLNQYEVLVLDEFDKMLDMGFVRDVRKIVNSMSNRKQTLLFSATKDKKQSAIIDEIIHHPILVEVSSGQSSSSNVDQDVIYIKKSENKFDLLVKLLKKEEFKRVILFMEMKHVASRLTKKLNNAGIQADCIHGDKSQNYRVNALDKFKRGAISVLVATDVAARGIDVNEVSHVINYQVPNDYDTYIHRVGRTGRAGKKGVALTFVDL